MFRISGRDWLPGGAASERPGPAGIREGLVLARRAQVPGPESGLGSVGGGGRATVPPAPCRSAASSGVRFSRTTLSRVRTVTSGRTAGRAVAALRVAAEPQERGMGVAAQRGAHEGQKRYGGGRRLGGQRVGVPQGRETLERAQALSASVALSGEICVVRVSAGGDALRGIRVRIGTLEGRAGRSCPGAAPVTGSLSLGHRAVMTPFLSPPQFPRPAG